MQKTVNRLHHEMATLKPSRQQSNLLWTARQKFGWQMWAPAILLILLTLPLLLLRLNTAPAMWFDEGYKANAARTLAELGVYGTASASGVIPFDAATTNGPIDTLAAAIAYRLLGPGAGNLRMGIIPFTLLAVLGLLQLATMMFGARTAVMSVLAVLAFPALERTSFLLMGRQVMGEIPALAMVAWGLWLWFGAWRPGAAAHWGVIGGIVVGLGVLSKTQIAISLAPAIGLISLAALLWRAAPAGRIIAPPVATAAMLATWKLLELAACQQADCSGNAAFLAAAIPTLLFTDLRGANVIPPGLLAASLMGLAALTTAWRLWRATQCGVRWTAGHWLQAVLGLWVAVYAGWFMLLSIGWTRYAFTGWIVALLLLGEPMSHLFDKISKAAAQRGKPHLARMLRPAVLAALVLLTILGMTAPIAAAPVTDALAAMSGYIDHTIAPDAVIETWEWELGVSTQHRNYTYPAGIYVLRSIQDQFHLRLASDMTYDALAHDPDYLVIGAFGALTGIYPAEIVAQHFALTHTEGPYRLYTRIRLVDSAP